MKGGGNITNEGGRMLCDAGVGKDAVIDMTEKVIEAPAKKASKTSGDSSETTPEPTPELDEDKKQVKSHSSLEVW